MSIVTLGCGRTEAEGDHVGVTLGAAGIPPVEDPAEADCVLVNACTVIEPARRESIDTILAACDLPGRSGRGVVGRSHRCEAPETDGEARIAADEVRPGVVAAARPVAAERVGLVAEPVGG